MGYMMIYPLVNIQKAIEHGPFSSLIYPLNMVIFQFSMLNYQRVNQKLFFLISILGEL